MATQTLLDEHLSNAPQSDMYFTGSEWLKGPAPAQVPPTTVPVTLWPATAAAAARRPAKVVFRSQSARLDWSAKWASAKAAPDLKIQSMKAYVEPEPEDMRSRLRREVGELPADLEEVRIGGKPYVQYGAERGGVKATAGPLKGHVLSHIDVPPLTRLAKQPDVMPLYDVDGRLKQPGDKPLGVAYDAEGLPIVDWELVQACDAKGRALIDAKGVRHAKYEVRGGLEDAVLLETTRAFPVWGKRFGLQTRKRVGRVGVLTSADAQGILEKESFGFRMAEATPVPPLVTLKYAEVHNECCSIVIEAGLSELHLQHKEPVAKVHYMLLGLGYVCYEPVDDQNDDDLELPRFWGEGISTAPSKVYAGDGGAIGPGQQGPTWYTWSYRLPPFVEGLALEGESGDPRGGPEALLRAQRLAKMEREQDVLLEARNAALSARVIEAGTQPWYRDYFPEGELDPVSGALVNAPGTLPGEALELVDADAKE